MASYEESIKRLNEIISKIENESVSMNEINGMLEEGKKLLENCYKEVDKTSGKLSELKEIAGKLEEV
jgi:exodeoxyribonuclease VII small subunit